ncbi:MAG TPA: HDOD domain-containing protein [Syntrophales bacterium]|nr:HDOD domain-containing protein [Syntrophales bacterium]HPI56317.1 HDOD domain-containing protein [Syntrophales bacterium]HPN24295.1 HDOD domain-containing protein [Syntrophales bacterium]HQM28647.1 HDOD domain-containing protein [Syntrophales bacterium]
MTLLVVFIFALLIGLAIFLLGSANGKSKKDDLMEHRKRPSEEQPQPARTAAHTQTSPKSEKTENMDQLKSTVLEGLNYITSNHKAVESKSHMPYELSGLSREAVDSIRWQVGEIKGLTSTYEMFLMLDDPNVDMSRVAKRISSDPVLSNKILRVANSAYFGSRMAMDSINHALAVLGLINIKSILFYNMVSEQSYGNQVQINPIYRSLLKHSVLTARCAVYLADAFEGLNKGKLYTLGLLHDIGEFVMSGVIRKKQIDDDFMLPFGKKECIISEDRLLGINHAVIGRIAFEGCGLSEETLRLIETHHFPSFYSRSCLSMKEEDKKYLAALFLANQIAKLFVDEEEAEYYAVQSLPSSYHDLVSLRKVKGIFSDHHVLSEMAKTKILTQSYIAS